MKKILIGAAVGVVLLAGCGSEETQYQGVCTDPNTHVALDPSNCSGGGSGGSDNAIWEYIILSQFLNNQSAYSPGHTVVNNSTTHVYHSLPKGSTSEVRYGSNRAERITTTKTGTVKKAQPVKVDVFKKTIQKVDKSKTQDLKKASSVKSGDSYRKPSNSYKAPSSGYSGTRTYRRK